MKRLFALVLLAFATLPFAGAAGVHAATPTELIANGGFETGNFSGWTVVNTGSGAWSINNGTFDPEGPGIALAPISGSFDALSHQPGPGFHALRQTIVVPSSIQSAILSWSDRIRNNAVYSDHNQEWRVLLLDSAGVQIHEFFSTNSGDPLIQIGPNGRSIDVTSLLQSLVGQTVTISFEEQDNLSFFNATLDNVSLQVTTLPTVIDDCKGGGWMTFIGAGGVSIFKNQGDCVSFVATGGKNEPGKNIPTPSFPAPAVTGPAYQ